MPARRCVQRCSPGRLAPMLTELVAVLRHFGELAIDEPTTQLLVSMSAATIDRRLAQIFRGMST